MSGVFQLLESHSKTIPVATVIDSHLKTAGEHKHTLFSKWRLFLAKGSFRSSLYPASRPCQAITASAQLRCYKGLCGKARFALRSRLGHVYLEATAVKLLRRFGLKLQVTKRRSVNDWLATWKSTLSLILLLVNPNSSKSWQTAPVVRNSSGGT